MARPTKTQALLRASRAGQEVPRVESPRVRCERSGIEVYAISDGLPRPHPCPARTGDRVAASRPLGRRYEVESHARPQVRSLYSIFSSACCVSGLAQVLTVRDILIVL